MLDLGSEFDDAQRLAPVFVCALIVAVHNQLPASDDDDCMEIGQFVCADGVIKLLSHVRQEPSFRRGDALPVIGWICMS